MERRTDNGQFFWTAALICCLGGVLFFFYFDRQIVSILKTTLMTEMNITNTKYSGMVTAFMLPYTLCYFFSGYIVDKFGSRYVLSCVAIIMAIASIITGCAHSYNQLLVGRVLLGIAESGAVPALTLSIFTWFRAEQRAFAFQITTMIQWLGLIAAPPFIAWITLAHGWRVAFFFPAVVGACAAVIWFFLSKKAPVAEDVGVRPEEANKLAALDRYKMVLSSAPVWMLIISRLLTDPFWFFYQYWQVGFMQEKIGLSLSQVGEMMWFPPLFSVVAVLGICRMSDKLVSKGVPSKFARLRILWICTFLSPLTLMLPLVSDRWVALAIMTAVNFMCAAWLTLSTIIMGELVSGSVIATAIGLMSAIGGVSSILFNGVVGSIIDKFGYSIPIYFGGLLHPLGALLLAFFFLRKKRVEKSQIAVQQ